MKDTKVCILMVTLLLVLVLHVTLCHCSPSNSKSLKSNTNKLLKDALKNYNTITKYLTRLLTAFERRKLSPPPTTTTTTTTDDDDNNNNNNHNNTYTATQTNTPTQNPFNNRAVPHEPLITTNNTTTTTTAYDAAPRNDPINNDPINDDPINNATHPQQSFTTTVIDDLTVLPTLYIGNTPNPYFPSTSPSWKPIKPNTVDSNSTPDPISIIRQHPGTVIPMANVTSAPDIQKSLIHPTVEIPMSNLTHSSEMTSTPNIRASTNPQKPQQVPGTLTQPDERTIPTSVIPILIHTLPAGTPTTPAMQSPYIPTYLIPPSPQTTTTAGGNLGSPRATTHPYFPEPDGVKPLTTIPLVMRSQNSSVTSPSTHLYSHEHSPPQPVVPFVPVHSLSVHPFRSNGTIESPTPPLLTAFPYPTYSSARGSLVGGIRNSNGEYYSRNLESGYNGGRVSSGESLAATNTSEANDEEIEIIGTSTLSESESLFNSSEGIKGGLVTQGETPDSSITASKEGKEHYYYRAPIEETYNNTKSKEKKVKNNQYMTLERETEHHLGTPEEKYETQIDTEVQKENQKTSIEKTNNFRNQKQKLKADVTMSKIFKKLRNRYTSKSENEDQYTNGDKIQRQEEEEGHGLQTENTTHTFTHTHKNHHTSTSESEEYNLTGSQDTEEIHNPKLNAENRRQGDIPKTRNPRHIIHTYDVEAARVRPSLPTLCSTSGLGRTWSICTRLHTALKGVEDAINDQMKNGLTSGRLWKLQRRTEILSEVTEKVEEGSYFLVKSDESLLLICIRRLNQTVTAAKEEMESKFVSGPNLIFIVSLCAGGFTLLVLIPIITGLLIARRRQMRREEIYQKVCAEQIPIQSFINQRHLNGGMTPGPPRHNPQVILQRSNQEHGKARSDCTGSTTSQHPQRKHSGPTCTSTFKYTKNYKSDPKTESSGSNARDTSVQPHNSK